METTLGDFIEHLKQGAYLWKPQTVVKIGNALEELAKKYGISLEQPIKVEFRGGLHVCGTDFVYWFQWTVRGVELPFRPGLYTSRNLGISSDVFFIRVHKNGFEFGYEA